MEEHLVDGVPKQLLVHRKGSTRAFPAHHPLIPVDYQLTGQPVLIGGTMGTHSYVLTGTARFMHLPAITCVMRPSCSLPHTFRQASISRDFSIHEGLYRCEMHCFW